MALAEGRAQKVVEVRTGFPALRKVAERNAQVATARAQNASVPACAPTLDLICIWAAATHAAPTATSTFLQTAPR